MSMVHLVAVLFLVIAILFYKKGNVNISLINKWSVYKLAVAALILRLIIAAVNQGFPSDIACFYSWSNMAYEGGLENFYTSGAFADYPPGYIYILYVLGFFHSVFKADYMSVTSLLILKLPAILSDIATGILIYKVAEKNTTKSRALFISALYFLNPTVILNSCVWGQVDAVMGFLLFLMCYLLMQKRMILSYITYGVGVLIKPQMLIFTPLIIYGFLENVIFDKFDKKKLGYNLLGGISVILGMVIVCYPFGVQNIIKLYTETLGSYPYVSVNAYNFWALLGKNWTLQEDKLLFMSYQNWGTIVILLVVAAATVFFYKARKKESKYFTTAAVLMISMFLFSVRMHERYLFPAMALLLLAYAVRPLKGFLISYVGVTLVQLYNTADVLFIYSKEGYTGNEGFIRLISLGTLFIGIFFYYKLYHYDVKGDEADKDMALTGAVSPKDAVGKTVEKKYVPMTSKKSLPFTWKDAIIILSVMIVYSAFAFYDLGDTEAPQTEYHMQMGESVILEIPEERQASWLYYYLGCFENREFLLEYKLSVEEEWQNNGIFTMNDVFRWAKLQLPENCRYIRITCQSDQASIMEMAFADASENAFVPQNAQDYSSLFDENGMFPSEGISFRNGTYFDEIYHARTGYEFLHGLYTYETTHPPLGKVFISLGIAMFGMTPFGWRFAGTVFGILMLPVIYLFARDIGKSRFLGGLASVLLAFDFMHFTQTRIATIDVFVTFFIILMYYFMYRYSKLSFYDTPLYKTFIPLGACGVTMGLAIASKWTGVYAAVGLAVIFFASLYRRYQEYRYAKINPSKTVNGIQNKDIVEKYWLYTVKTIEFCLIVFIVVPIVIYVLSYIPFKSWDEGLIHKAWQNQINMFSYHSGLTDTHPYASAWYEWPTMARPILYYWQGIGDSARQTISAFGNPLIWWIGIPAFIYMVYLALCKKDKMAMFLCVGYLAEYFPWCLVPRITFIYHYFPSVPFVVLMLIYSAKKLKEHMSEKTWYVFTITYAAAVVCLFVLFYPVLSGQTVSNHYVDAFLRWMESWVL